MTTLITDQYQRPLPDLPVTVMASNLSDRDIIGINTSNSEGLAKIRTIVPQNASEYTIEINVAAHHAATADSSLSSIIFTAPLEDNAINDIRDNDLILDLGQTMLNRLASFELWMINNTNSPDTLLWELTYESRHKIVSMVDPSTQQLISKMEGRVLPMDLSQSLKVRVVDNDTLTLNYQLINQGVVFSGQDLIPMNSEDQIYVFEY